jgi:RNA polymerase sigma factor (sigma-70 family)
MLDDPWWHSPPPGMEELDPAIVERIKDAVEALPDDERAVIECLVWGQMSKVEVGELLGKTRQFVYEVEKRAHQMLREALGGLDD